MHIPILPLTAKQIARFWAKVDKSGGPDACWPWQGGKKGKKKKARYGEFRLSKPRRVVRSHRVARAIASGIDPCELFVCHHCDNPPCCNPKHLFPGTVQDNSTDMIKKGRAGKFDRSGENNGDAKLSYADVEQVRRLILQKFTNVEIGARFGVSHALISAIRRGKVWGGKPMTKRYESLRKAA